MIGTRRQRRGMGGAWYEDYNPIYQMNRAILDYWNPPPQAAPAPVPTVGVGEMTPAQAVAAAQQPEPEVMVPERTVVYGPQVHVPQQLIPIGAKEPQPLPGWAKMLLGLGGASVLLSVLGVALGRRRARRR